MTPHEYTAHEHGKNFANRMFVLMLNPNCQSESFSWNNFPNTWHITCASQLFLYYNKTPDNYKDLQELAKNSFYQEALRLIEQYQQNQPLPIKK